MEKVNYSASELNKYKNYYAQNGNEAANPNAPSFEGNKTGKRRGSFLGSTIGYGTFGAGVGAAYGLAAPIGEDAFVSAKTKEVLTEQFNQRVKDLETKKAKLADEFSKAGENISEAAKKKMGIKLDKVSIAVDKLKSYGAKKYIEVTQHSKTQVVKNKLADIAESAKKIFAKGKEKVLTDGVKEAFEKTMKNAKTAKVIKNVKSFGIAGLVLGAIGYLLRPKRQEIS